MIKVVVNISSVKTKQKCGIFTNKLFVAKDIRLPV